MKHPKKKNNRQSVAEPKNVQRPFYISCMLIVEPLWRVKFREKMIEETACVFSGADSKMVSYGNPFARSPGGESSK
ncbi:hypothetical protein [Cytobacillus kochii]